LGAGTGTREGLRSLIYGIDPGGYDISLFNDGIKIQLRSYKKGQVEGFMKETKACGFLVRLIPIGKNSRSKT